MPASVAGISDANTAYAKDDGSGGRIALFNTSGGATNLPSAVGTSTAGSILSYTRFGGTEYLVTQIYTSENNTGGLTTWIRRGRFLKTAVGSETFEGWARCDNYGTSSLSELATALGSVGGLGYATSNVDNIVTPTLSPLYIGANATGTKAFSGGHFLMVWCNGYYTTQALQIAFVGNEMKRRINNGTTWSAWIDM